MGGAKRFNVPRVEPIKLIYSLCFDNFDGYREIKVNAMKFTYIRKRKTGKENVVKKAENLSLSKIIEN